MNFANTSKMAQALLIQVGHLFGLLFVIALIGPCVTQAQVPPDIEAGLIKIGHIVDPTCTAKLYRPLMPANDISSSATPLYQGITIVRDQSFGPDPKDVVDVFTSDKGPANRPVLMYVPGGAGNKIEPGKAANAFFDNIGRWGTENGMVVVLMQRHGGGDYYSGAKDVSAMIQWVEANISKYQGNPDRMFIWAHSAGNGPLGIYIGHPELYGPKGVGVKGVIFMSGQFNIIRPDGTNPVPPPAGPGGNPLAGAGVACGATPPGGGAGEGVAAGRGPGGQGGAGRSQVSQEELIMRSSLPEFEKTKVKVFLASAELDPGVDGAMSPFNQAFHDELCKLGPEHCPTMLFEKGESHMGEVFAIDTPDKSVSGPLLAWMKEIK
jgi:triacylglycerol lipase